VYRGCTVQRCDNGLEALPPADGSIVFPDERPRLFVRAVELAADKDHEDTPREPNASDVAELCDEVDRVVNDRDAVAAGLTERQRQLVSAFGIDYAYEGRITEDRVCTVVVVRTSDGKERALRSCTDIVNHSPTGFAWGYLGSGPAQLALALCVNALFFDGAGIVRAQRVYQRVKNRLVSLLDQEKPWRLSRAQVLIAIFAAENTP
jgi:hypothetical protein